MTSPSLPPQGNTSWFDWAQWLHDQATKVANKLGVADLSATGTRDTTTFLRGDNTWAAPPSGTGGTVSDATATTKGVVQLAGDLGGTAAAPTVTSGAGHSHTAAQVSDASTVGRSVLTAADAAAARAALGAGTSSLALGTTSTTAKAGNWAPTVVDVPAGSVLYSRQNADGTWPNRPTSRTDITVIWTKTVTGSADPAAATAPAVTGAYSADLVMGV